jgi:hypothetical protein
MGTLEAISRRSPSGPSQCLGGLISFTELPFRLFLNDLPGFQKGFTSGVDHMNYGLSDWGIS